MPQNFFVTVLTHTNDAKVTSGDRIFFVPLKEKFAQKHI